MTRDIRIGFFRSNGFRNSSVNAANLIETATFRQSCCEPSSRHRSCFALWTFEIAFYPSDNSPSAATISQGTTQFSNWWVPEVDVGSQQLSLLCGRWGFLIHFSFGSLVCAIRFFSQVRFSVCGGATKFSSGVTSSSSASANCMA